jgi:N-acetylglutamate synthase-like GNAT family acetyltransferase
MIATIIHQPTESEFEQVKKYAKQFNLDDENMERNQFKVLLQDNKLAAFGRLKVHKDAIELCTLGVVEEFRGKKLGETFVRDFIANAKQDIYVVTVIPAFFSKLGFKEVKEYPASIKEKSDRCGNKYHVDESYVAMKHSF